MTDQEYKELYESGLTTREIASRAGVTNGTVRLHLIKIGVHLRSRWKNNKGLFKKGLEPKNKVKLTENQLEEVKNKFNNYIPLKQIAEDLGVGEGSISRITKELKLDRDFGKMMSRPQYDGDKDEEIIKLYKEGKSSVEIGKLLGMEHSYVLSHLKHCNFARRTLSEAQLAHNDKEFPTELEKYETLFDMYVIQKLSKKDIGLQLNVSPSVVDRMLHSFNIPVRGVKETLQSRVNYGPESSNWKGGRTGLYMRLRSVLSNALTKETLDRDNHTCQLCGKTEHLEVHHVKSFKEIFNEILKENNITEDNLLDDEEKLYDIMRHDSRFLDPNNLITYCRDCHLFEIHGYKRKKNITKDRR